MRTPFALLKYAARALGNAVGFGVGGDVLVDVLPDVARDVWGWWSKGRDAEQRRAELEGMAGAAGDEVRRAVEAAVAEEAAGRPEAVRAALGAFLSQVPAAIRRTTRRPADPTGRTVPAALVPREAADLLRLLPARLPRFGPGDRPFADVDWVLVELLGAGGFGEVWKAVNPHLPNAEPAALKFCLDAAAANALRNEADLLNRVMHKGRHPGIVQLRHTYLASQTPCLEYDYVEGGDLSGLIQQWHAGPGAGGVAPADLPSRAAGAVMQLAEIVGFAHRLSPPIVHRDLKPANILVRRPGGGRDGGREGGTGEGYEFLVADFGIGGLAAGDAARQTARGATQGARLVGTMRGSYTPIYSSPQQAVSRPPDVRDDVFSLGVVWYQMLTGDLGASAPRGTGWRRRLAARGVPPAHLDLLASNFEEHPADRPKDAAALAAELSGLLGRASEAVGEPPTARPHAALPPMPPMMPMQPMQPMQWLPPLSPLPPSQPFLIPAPAAAPLTFTNSVGMKFVKILPGHFLMGSPPDEDRRCPDENQHKVILTRGYWLGAHQVTQTQWRAVMGKNPAWFEGDDLPVEQVSWTDCQEFCRKLSEKDGMPYRLPTEAEWEYACRAGTTTPFYFGRTISTEQANYDGDYAYDNGRKGVNRQTTTAVGSCPANAWGLHQMHGNVYEWCEDTEAVYAENDQTDPLVKTSSQILVTRGGSWDVQPEDCRSAARMGIPRDTRSFNIGCRLALSSLDVIQPFTL